MTPPETVRWEYERCAAADPDAFYAPDDEHEWYRKGSARLRPDVVVPGDPPRSLWDVIPPFPEKSYDLIVIDPPWLYKDGRDKKSAGMARAHYPPLPFKVLARMPMHVLCNDRAMVMVWATGPKMVEATALYLAWGMTYCTVLFVWEKTYGDPLIAAPRRGTVTPATTIYPYSGMGHHTCSGTEFLLLGRFGKRPLARLRKDVKQVIHAPVRDHSRKPTEALGRIERLYGDRPRLEMFARPPVASGWDAWGDEA